MRESLIDQKFWQPQTPSRSLDPAGRSCGSHRRVEHFEECRKAVRMSLWRSTRASSAMQDSRKRWSSLPELSRDFREPHLGITAGTPRLRPQNLPKIPVAPTVNFWLVARPARHGTRHHHGRRCEDGLDLLAIESGGLEERMREPLNRLCEPRSPRMRRDGRAIALMN